MRTLRILTGLISNRQHFRSLLRILDDPECANHTPEDFKREFELTIGYSLSQSVFDLLFESLKEVLDAYRQDRENFILYFMEIDR